MNALKFLFSSDDSLAFWLRIGIVSLTVLFVLTSYMNSAPPVSPEPREYHEENKENNIVKDMQTLAPMESLKKHENSGTNKEKTESSFIKDKRDLNAQEGVWRATNLVAFLTIIATSLAAIGVYFLRETMIATGNTLEAANRTADAAESAERAHLLVKFDLDPIRNSEGRHRLDIEVVNVGKTPAVNVQAGYEWTVPNKICIGADFTPIPILPTNESEEVTAVSFGRSDGLPVSVTVTISSYEDIFGGEHGGVVGKATINEKMELISSIELPSVEQA